MIRLLDWLADSETARKKAINNLNAPIEYKELGDEALWNGFWDVAQNVINEDSHFEYLQPFVLNFGG